MRLRTKSATWLSIALSIAVATAQFVPIKYMSKVLPGNEEGSCPLPGEINDIRHEIQQEIQEGLREYILTVTNCSTGTSLDNPATSCADIPTHCDSGEYWVTSSSGTATKVYCDTTPPCCNSSVTSMRVALLNMSDPNQQCPDNWREIESPRRSCRRLENDTMSSVTFPTHGINYSQICGRIIAYQYGGTEAFKHYNLNVNAFSIDDNFADGITITYGTPRNHVWTFVSAISEGAATLEHICQCTNTSANVTNVSPPWVGQDYFCETGADNSAKEGTYYSDDPLWDGEGCGESSECCSFNIPPWFCKRLPQTTNADIEIRIMSAAFSIELLENEGTPIEVIELYIQ